MTRSFIDKGGAGAISGEEVAILVVVVVIAGVVVVASRARGTEEAEDKAVSVEVGIGREVVARRSFRTSVEVTVSGRIYVF